jgi:hypothetical protein
MTVTCTHLDSIELTALPSSIPGCEDCVAMRRAPDRSFRPAG